MEGIIAIIGIALAAFVIFCIYFFFKQLEFVLVSVNLYRKMVNRQDAMIQLLIDIRDNTKSYEPNVIHALDSSDASSTKGKIGVDYDASGVITQVFSGGAASDAGIKVGDKILKVGGKPVPSGNRELIIAMLAGAPSTELNVDIQRGTEQLAFTLRRS